MKIKKIVFAVILNLTNEILLSDLYETKEQAKNALFAVRDMKNWRISKIMIKEL